MSVEVTGCNLLMQYNKDGSKKEEQWCLNGGLRREDGAAWIEYNENGSKSLEKWYLNGEWHRTDGPAWIEHRQILFGRCKLRHVRRI